MKRFAKTISLAACLVFLCGATAMAQDAIVVQSKSVAPNSVGVTLEVLMSNSQAATGFVLPLELREITPGSYVTTAFTSVATGRLNNSPLGPAGTDEDGNLPDSGWPAASVTARKYNNPAAQSCSGPVSSSWTTAAGNIGFTSPDALLHATVSQGDESIGEDIDMNPGSDSPGSPSYLMTFNVTGVLGQFIVDTMCATPASHLGYVNRATQFVPMAFTAGIVTIEVPPDPCPAGSIDNAVVNATVGSNATNDADGNDAPDNDPIVFTMKSGPGSVNAATGEWSYSPTCADVAASPITVEIYVSDNAHTPDGCGFVSFQLNVSPAQLQITCGNVSAHWAGADASQTVSASGGCPPYTYSVQSGLGSINPSTGAYSYDQGCSDVGSSSVTVRVTDANQSFVDCIFTLSITNTIPVCSNIPPTLAPQGVPTCIDLGDTVQGDGDALTYTYVGGLPPAWAPTIVADQFCATRPAGDAASYTVTYTVSDGCATVTCTFDLIFENPCVTIVKQGTDSAYACELNGALATVCVVAEAGSIPGDAGGYDFLICYDQSGLSFIGATGGPEGWEYFTYRTGMLGGNCGGGCPDGFVRLVSIAEMNNGTPVDPADFDINGDVLACMTFLVTSDRTFIGSCLHVGFCSFDCGDNVISSKSGDTLWSASGGTSEGPNMPAECPDTEKGENVPAIFYCPGAICVCRPLDDRGDLNLNGIANEIGDAVLYTNYFIYGSSVWNPTWDEIQILASDINNDGIVLTVADLIYLIRIITGDESPFPPLGGGPKLSPYSNSVTVSNDVANGVLNVSTTSSVEIGAALLVYRYSDLSVGAPVLTNESGLQIRSNAANGELRILVSQDAADAASARLNAGANSLLTIPVEGNGTIELVESQFSDYNGALLTVTAAHAVVPTEYALLQNYPNPFNAGTVIPFSLLENSDYELTIYNVAGQVVRTFTGNGVGNISVTWDGRTVEGSEVASGMYFYRVNASNFTATKKMVLLK